MPDVHTIQQSVRERLVELDGLIERLSVEADQLRELAATFEDAGKRHSGSSSPHRRPSGGVSRRSHATNFATSTGRDTPRGATRALKALELIEAKPGITASELAHAMGISPSYLYRVLSKLVRNRKIEKRAKGYHSAMGQMGKPAGSHRDQVRAIGKRLVVEHAEALRILAEHDPETSKARR
jgi:predicted transcriptional regulator